MTRDPNKRIEELEKRLREIKSAFDFKDGNVDDLMSWIEEYLRDIQKLQAEVERLRGRLKYNSQYAIGVHNQDNETITTLQAENKKIGGVLADICKLLKDSGVEKRYFDEADLATERTARMEAERAQRFIAHIQSHLTEGQTVICKICGKEADAC